MQASLFPANSRTPGATLLQFAAGKCTLTQLSTGKYLVTPDMRRGQIQLSRGADGFLHFRWCNLSNGAFEDDRMVMGGDCQFAKVKTTRENDPKDRIYMLKFSGNPKPMMFWMQDQDSSKDEENVKKTNSLLSNSSSTGRPIASSNANSASFGGLPANLLQLLGRPITQPSTLATATPQESIPQQPTQQAPTGNAFGQLDLSRLLGATSAQAAVTSSRNSLTPPLQHILTAEEIFRVGLLNDQEVVNDLLTYLPEGHRSSDNLSSTLRSAQFQQSLRSLTSALQNSDNYQTVLSNFQLNPLHGNDHIVRGDRVGAFVSAVNSSVEAASTSTEENGDTVTGNSYSENEMDQT